MFASIRRLASSADSRAPAKPTVGHTPYPQAEHLLLAVQPVFQPPVPSAIGICQKIQAATIRELIGFRLGPGLLYSRC